MSKRDSLRLDWRRGNVRVLRAHYEQACRVEPKDAHEWQTLDLDGRRLRLLIHKTEAPSDRAIFYFHGGGWIVGSPATHADVSSALAAATGLPVISIGYRLAPEYAADAAIADGLAVLRHFLGPAAHQYRSAILCGDSAGGSLALAVERNATDLRANIMGAASFYGCFGLAANASLHRDPRLSDGLDALSVERYWRATNGSLGVSPYSISSLALGEGCPIHLVIAGRDPLAADSIALARALRDKGRPVTVDHHLFEGHSFLQQALARGAGQLAFARIAQWMDTLDPACHKSNLSCLKI
jgi:acetyl esterase